MNTRTPGPLALPIHVGLIQHTTGWTVVDMVGPDGCDFDCRFYHAESAGKRAEQIATACNSHDALTARCERLRNVLASFTAYHGELASLRSRGATMLPDIAGWVLDEARAALSEGD